MRSRRRLAAPSRARYIIPSCSSHPEQQSNLRSWPDAAAFDPEAGAASSALAAIVRGPGAALPAVLLVGAAADPWVTRSTAAIARAFVATGRRIVLVDAGVGAPSLHAQLGVGSDEGLLDHFAFGTSLERLAQPVEDGSWSVVAAGPSGAASSIPGTAAEWDRLVADAAAREVTLLVYAPWDTPGVAELAARLGAVIGLASGSADRAALASVVARPFGVLAVFEPAVPGPAPAEPPLPEAAAPLPSESGVPRPAASAAAVLPRDAAARSELIAELRARQRAALQAPPEPVPGGEEPEEVPGLRARGPAAAAGGWTGADAPAGPETLRSTLAPEEPPVQRRKAPERPRVRWPLLALLAVVSLAAGAWHLWGRWQEAEAARAAAAAPAPVARPVPPPAPVPDTLDAPLPFVIAIEAHQDLPTAERRVLALRRTLTGVGFLIAPLVREGTLYYHVAAGPVRDSVAAQTLLDTLMARRIKTGSTPNDVRAAPLAFLVAEYATQDSAEARVAELRRLDIPTYVLAHGAEPPRWRLYAGGYNGSAEADVMRQLLESAGVPDSLVPRTGRISR